MTCLFMPCSATEEARLEVPRISSLELGVRIRQNEAQVVDVRNLEFHISRIPGSRHAPSAEFKKLAPALVADLGRCRTVIAFLCSAGEGRARSCAMQFLQQLNSHMPHACCDVRVLEGGFNLWERHFATSVDVAVYISRGFVYEPTSRVEPPTRIQCRRYDSSPTASKVAGLGQSNTLPFRSPSGPVFNTHTLPFRRCTSAESLRLAKENDGGEAVYPHRGSGEKQVRFFDDVVPGRVPNEYVQTTDSLPELVPVPRLCGNSGETSDGSSDEDRVGPFRSEDSCPDEQDPWYSHLSIGDLVRVRSNSMHCWTNAIVVALGPLKAKVQFMMKNKACLKVVALESQDLAPRPVAPPPDPVESEYSWNGVGDGSDAAPAAGPDAAVPAAEGAIAGAPMQITLPKTPKPDKGTRFSAYAALAVATKACRADVFVAPVSPPTSSAYHALDEAVASASSSSPIPSGKVETWSALPVLGLSFLIGSSRHKQSDTCPDLPDINATTIPGLDHGAPAADSWNEQEPVLCQRTAKRKFSRRLYQSWDPSAHDILVEGATDENAENANRIDERWRGETRVLGLDAKELVDSLDTRSSGCKYSSGLVRVNLPQADSGLQAIDVRDADFFDGRVPGARHMPATFFDVSLPALAREFASTGKVLVLYSDKASVQRSTACARQLLSHLEVRVLRGGFQAFADLHRGAAAVL
mmetsp:Transcript_118380/g.379503  ORF Transcript_118380/g.379503 Transcript_118380/m.379503 type:complete len:696 (-) Transcript_118380:149-2236(-)